MRKIPHLGWLTTFAIVLMAHIDALAQSPALARATVVNGSVTGIQVLQGGSGYAHNPLVTITAANGVGASAKAALVGGSVTAVSVISGGSGYTSPPTVTIADPGDTVDQGLVGLYNFDQNSLDFSGYGNSGVLHGGKYVSDRFGNQNGAFSFNGQDNYIEMPKPLPDLTSATVSVWISLADWYGLQAVFFDGDANPGKDFGCYISGGFVFVVRSDDQARYTKWLPAVGSWTHLVMVADAANHVVELWSDGTLLATSPFTPGTLGATFGYHSNLVLGVRAVYNDWPFNGSMDDLRIYDHALTHAEIQTLYSRQLGKPFGVQLAVSSYAVTMNLQPGSRYQLQGSTDLVHWIPIGDPFMAVDAVTKQDVPVTDEARYFRVLQAP